MLGPLLIKVWFGNDFVHHELASLQTPGCHNGPKFLETCFEVLETSFSPKICTNSQKYSRTPRKYALTPRKDALTSRKDFE